MLHRLERLRSSVVEFTIDSRALLTSQRNNRRSIYRFKSLPLVRVFPQTQRIQRLQATYLTQNFHQEGKLENTFKTSDSSKNNFETDRSSSEAVEDGIGASVKPLEEQVLNIRKLQIIINTMGKLPQTTSSCSNLSSA